MKLRLMDDIKVYNNSAVSNKAKILEYLGRTKNLVVRFIDFYNRNFKKMQDETEPEIMTTGETGTGTALITESSKIIKKIMKTKMEKIQEERVSLEHQQIDFVRNPILYSQMDVDDIDEKVDRIIKTVRKLADLNGIHEKLLSYYLEKHGKAGNEEKKTLENWFNTRIIKPITDILDQMGYTELQSPVLKILDFCPKELNALANYTDQMGNLKDYYVFLHVHQLYHLNQYYMVHLLQQYFHHYLMIRTNHYYLLKIRHLNLDLIEPKQNRYIYEFEYVQNLNH